MSNKFAHKKYKAKYTNSGIVKRPSLFQNTKCNETSRIPPNYKWFQSTRQITIQTVDKYKAEEEEKITSPYDVLINKSKIPYSLFLNNENIKLKQKPDYREIRKGKPEIKFNSLLEYKQQTEVSRSETANKQKTNLTNNSDKKEYRVKKCAGQSSRIWSELYKVIDSSQVLIYVVDCRDPLNTISLSLISTIKEKNKPLFIILNKTDLIPTSVTQKWMQYLLEKINVPILSFSASSIERNFGKQSLLNLMRQYTKLFRKPSNYKRIIQEKVTKEGKIDSNQKASLECVSFGLIGMPNVGKSSIINVIKQNKVCSVAPIPGETKVWQYVAVSRFMYVIDCPGIVPIKDESKAILRGAVRIEKLSEDDLNTATSDIFINYSEEIKKTYMFEFSNKEEFIEIYGRKYGKLTKGNVVNQDAVLKIILKDFLSGKISSFELPPTDL
ncbi:Nucleolar GTP-binding protein 2 [Cucumispora dikerogammari]|nr:Nucleolar GTP-binding protein 2 [Cucumispora dikerogammari]